MVLDVFWAGLFFSLCVQSFLLFSILFLFGGIKSKRVVFSCCCLFSALPFSLF